MQEGTVPPPDDSEGINREHGEDDPIGTKTVAAPATVSGLLSILAALKRRATAGHRGKANGKRISASQETCRQAMKPKRTGCSDGYELAFAQRPQARRTHAILPPEKSCGGLACISVSIVSHSGLDPSSPMA